MAAMTCPGVPTLRKRLRPAERVETESAIYAGARSRVAPRLCNSVHLLYWVAPIRGSRTQAKRDRKPELL